MAKLKIVPPKHYEILNQYLGSSVQGGVVLVPEEVIGSEHFPKERADALRRMDGADINYAFGGEPDVLVDIVLSNDSYALSELFADTEEGGENHGEDEC